MTNAHVCYTQQRSAVWKTWSFTESGIWVVRETVLEKMHAVHLNRQRACDYLAAQTPSNFWQQESLGTPVKHRQLGPLKAQRGSYVVGWEWRPGTCILTSILGNSVQEAHRQSCQPPGQQVEHGPEAKALYSLAVWPGVKRFKQLTSSPHMSRPDNVRISQLAVKIKWMMYVNCCTHIKCSRKEKLLL